MTRKAATLRHVRRVPAGWWVAVLTLPALLPLARPGSLDSLNGLFHLHRLAALDRSAVAEDLSFVWFPLILWAFRRLVTDSAEVTAAVHGEQGRLGPAVLLLTHGLFLLCFAPLLAQHDGDPGGGFSPTSRWLPGEIVPDAHHLEVPGNLPPGRYELWAGMYEYPWNSDALSGAVRNLAVVSSQVPTTENRILLGEVEVEGP